MSDVKTTAPRPDPDRFVKDERPRDFEIEVDVRGTIRLHINAGSQEEAREKARSMVADDDFGRELDHVDSADIMSLRKSATMFLITRDGRPMRTSHLQPGDEPRSPDERGF